MVGWSAYARKLFRRRLRTHDLRSLPYAICPDGGASGTYCTSPGHATHTIVMAASMWFLFRALAAVARQWCARAIIHICFMVSQQQPETQSGKGKDQPLKEGTEEIREASAAEHSAQQTRAESVSQHGRQRYRLSTRTTKATHIDDYRLKPLLALIIRSRCFLAGRMRPRPQDTGRSISFWVLIECLGRRPPK